MTIYILLAYFWGLTQLFILATPTRTIRVRGLVIAFLSGMYVPPFVALVLEQIWIRTNKNLTNTWIVDVTHQASYTISPFIEELAKLMPLFLILCWARVRERIGITDIVILGAAMGSGFGFSEITPRIVHLAANSYWMTGIGGGEWIVSSGLSSKTIPGFFEILTTFLPTPLGTGVLFDTRFAHFAGLKIEVMEYNYHLAWSAIAALGVGIYVRSSKKNWAWLALILLIWVSGVHAFENYALRIYPEANPVWAGFIKMSAALGGFGRGMSVLVLFSLGIAIIIDWRWVRFGLTEEISLRLGDGKKQQLLDLPGEAGLVSFIHKYGWSGALRIRDYIQKRRSLMYLKDHRHETAEVTNLREELIAEKECLEDDKKLQSIHAARNHVIRKLHDSTRYRRLIGVQIFAGLLFLIPSILYLVAAVFPNTHTIQALFTNKTIFYFVQGLTVLGIALITVRLFVFYRGLPSAKKILQGQELGAYLLRGVVAHGALLTGLAGVLLALTGGPTATLVDVLHISENGDIVLAIDLIMLMFAVIGIMGIFFPLSFPVSFTLFKLFFTLIDLWISFDTLTLLREKGKENLTSIERLEFTLAWANIVLSPLGIAEDVLKLDGLLFNSFDIADGGVSYIDFLADLIQSLAPDPVDWSTPWQAMDTFKEIRFGDNALLKHQYVDALRHYNSAQQMTTKAKMTPLTKIVIKARIGEVLRAQGNNHQAQSAYQDALQQLPSSDILPKTQADLILEIGDVQVDLTEYLSAIDSYESALSIYQSTGAEPIRIAEILLKLSEVWLQLGDEDRALELLQQILDLLMHGGVRSLEKAALFEKLGEAFLEVSKPNLAEQSFQFGIEEYQGLDNPRALELMQRMDDLR